MSRCNDRCDFFFSSRRRHTRSLCDWSSDVCSSDLSIFQAGVGAPCRLVSTDGSRRDKDSGRTTRKLLAKAPKRSEERRVGKECRCRWWPQYSRKQKNILQCVEG